MLTPERAPEELPARSLVGKAGLELQGRRGEAGKVRQVAPVRFLASLSPGGDKPLSPGNLSEGKTPSPGPTRKREDPVIY